MTADQDAVHRLAMCMGANHHDAIELIEKLRTELAKRAFHNGVGDFANIEYCDFCSYSRAWIDVHGHSHDCLVRSERS